MATNAKSGAKPAKAWASYTHAQYADAVLEMVHHSFKLTNSNIKSGGVRVAKEYGVRMPYVSVRTLIGYGHSILLDSFGKGPREFPIHNQILAVAQGKDVDVPAEDRDLINSLLSQAAVQGYVKCESLSPRLRQIFLPVADGYLAVSPIASAGLALRLSNEITAHNAAVNTARDSKAEPVNAEENQSRSVRKIKRATLSLGGANPFNAGNLVYYIDSPLIGAFPTSNNSLRHAKSLYYKGQQDLSFPRQLILDYTSWRNGIRGETTASPANREKHAELIKRFSRHWLSAGAEARELIMDHADVIENAQLVDPSLSQFDRGLVDPRQRDGEWATAFGSRLAKALMLLEKDSERKYEYAQSELNDIKKIAKDFVR